MSIIVSCNNYVKLDEKKLNEQRVLYMRLSMNMLGEKEYWTVYTQINDSIKNWRRHGLKWYSEDSTQIQYQVDSLLCFNLNGDKMRTTRIGKSVKKDNSTMDDVTNYYGVRKKGTWYFFVGGTMHIPREY
jgi:hypothetical protein